ncbi:MAG: hypothetical protein II943_12200 [Victivallales bacterium]|nr:hypothetical protein [Victivallales bacterium]
MHFRNWLILTVALLLVLYGCHSVSPPPGFVSGETGTAGRVEFPPELSKAAQYSLLVCYVDQEGEDAARWAAATLAVAKNARQRLLEELRVEQAKALHEKYSTVFDIDATGCIVWKENGLASRADWDELETMFADVEEFLTSKRAVVVPVAEIEEYLQSRRDAAQRKRFNAWLKAGHDALALLSDDTAGQLDMLNRRRASVRAKRILLEAESSATASMQSGQGMDAVERLDAALQMLDENATPEVLGDYTTRPRIEAMRRQAPQLIVARELQSLSELPLEEWQSGEERLSKDLLAWRKDFRFTEALAQNAEVIHMQVGIFRQQRLQSVTSHVHELLAAGNLVYRTARGFLIEEYGRLWPPCTDDALYCYFDEITEDLGQSLLTEIMGLNNRMLSDAGQFMLAVQQRADEIENRFGLVVGVDFALQAIPDDFDGAVVSKEDFALSRQRAAHAREMLLKQKFRKAVGVRRFSSELPGVGLAWQRDIERRLDGFLKASPLGKFLQIHGDLPEDGELSSEIALADGLLADYESGSAQERIATRVFRCVSAPHREILNGQRAQYVQELYDQEIVTRTIERTARIRLSLVIRLAGTEERRVEINEFLRREFVVEETRPLQVAGQHVVDDLTQTLPVAVAPELRVDRVWSEGEMLDEARRRVLDQVLLQLLEALTSGLVEKGNHLEDWDWEDSLSLSQVAQAMDEMGEFEVLLELWNPQNLLESLPPLPENPSEPHAAIYQQLVEHLTELQRWLSLLSMTA